MFSREQSACTVIFFSEKAPLSSVSLFEGGGAAVCFPRVKTYGCRGMEGIELMGLAGGAGWWVERGLSLSRSSAANEGERLDDDDAISLTSFDPAASALLGYAQEEQEMSEGEEAEAEPAQSSCPAYDELLEVMERATARLDLPWKRAKMAPRGKKKLINKKNIYFFFLKTRFPLASIGFSIPVMLTLRGCVETAMRDAPCGRDAISLLSLCGRDILSQGSLLAI